MLSSTINILSISTLLFLDNVQAIFLFACSSINLSILKGLAFTRARMGMFKLEKLEKPENFGKSGSFFGKFIITWPTRLSKGDCCLIIYLNRFCIG